MNRLTVFLTAIGFGLVSILASATAATAGATNRIYDANSKTWVEYTPGRRYGGKSPVKRKTVDYDGPYKANTIIVDTEERRLYYVMGDGKALKYGIGVGREGFQWSGSNRISRKAEWPGWTPPPAMRKRQPGLPTYMEGGIDNPLGARALYIGSTIYRIHGSNEPWTIGQAVSSGCIRMTNDDVSHLYNQVKVGTRVVVLR